MRDWRIEVNGELLKLRGMISVCFCGCIVHKQKCEGISVIWIYGFVKKRKRDYKCEQ